MDLNVAAKACFLITLSHRTELGIEQTRKKRKYILSMDSFNVLCEDTHTHKTMPPPCEVRKKRQIERKKECGTMDMFVQIK